VTNILLIFKKDRAKINLKNKLRHFILKLELIKVKKIYNN